VYGCCWWWLLLLLEISFTNDSYCGCCSGVSVYGCRRWWLLLLLLVISFTIYSFCRVKPQKSKRQKQKTKRMYDEHIEHGCTKTQ
jgi:hypothetical protein